jgi:hypothetical protein
MRNFSALAAAIVASILIASSVLVGSVSVFEHLSGPAAKVVAKLAESALPKFEPSDFIVGAKWLAPERDDFLNACRKIKPKADLGPTGFANMDGLCDCIAAAATTTTSHADRLILRYGFMQNKFAVDELALAMEKAGRGSEAINEASQHLQPALQQCLWGHP